MIPCLLKKNWNKETFFSKEVHNRFESSIVVFFRILLNSMIFVVALVFVHELEESRYFRASHPRINVVFFHFLRKFCVNEAKEEQNLENLHLEIILFQKGINKGYYMHEKINYSSFIMKKNCYFRPLIGFFSDDASNKFWILIVE